MREGGIGGVLAWFLSRLEGPCTPRANPRTEEVGCCGGANDCALLHSHAGASGTGDRSAHSKPPKQLARRSLPGFGGVWVGGGRGKVGVGAGARGQELQTRQGAGSSLQQLGHRR